MTPEWQRDANDALFGQLFLGERTTESETVRLEGDGIFEVEVLGRVHGHTTSSTGTSGEGLCCSDRRLGVGLMRWEGGEYLGNFLARCGAVFEGKVVVEVGCGAAPLPSLAAVGVGARKIVVTDGCDEVLEMARRNVLTHVGDPALRSALSFRRLSWSSAPEREALLEECQELDWVVGADVVYSREGVEALFEMLAAVVARRPQVRILLAYVVRGVSAHAIEQCAKSKGLEQKPLLPELSAALPETTTVRVAVFGRTRRSVKCGKCGQLGNVSLRQGHVLCVPCLLEHVEAKFCKAFKLKGAVQPGDQILLEATGRLPAQCALDLLLRYRHPDPTTTRRGKTHFGLTLLSCPEALSSVQSILRLHPEASADVTVQSAQCKEIDWAGRFPELDASTWADLLRWRREQFLLKESQRRGCNVLVSLESSTFLAHRLISISCKGGGYGIPAGMALLDRRHVSSAGVTRIRLLHELSVRELAYYARFRRLDVTSVAPFAAKTVDAASELFIHALQEAYPSGVSSVVSMGTKLRPFQDYSSLCPICTEPMETDAAVSYCYACQRHVISKLDETKLKELLLTLSQT